MNATTRERVQRGLATARVFARALYVGVDSVDQLTPEQLAFLEDIERAFGATIGASMSHDHGAIARCSFCKRYTSSSFSLSQRGQTCDCGRRDGWSGSFEAPDGDSRWSIGHLLGAT